MGINYDEDDQEQEEMKGESGMIKSFEKPQKGAGGRTFSRKPK